MPSLTSFEVCNLVLARRQRSQNFVVEPGFEEVTVGLSGSSVSTYKLAPSPQLVFSYAVSPITIVTSLCKNGNLLFFATEERKRFFLHKLVVEGSEESIITIELPALASQITLFGHHLYVRYNDSTIACLNSESLQEKWSSNSIKNDSAEFCEFYLDDDNLRIIAVVAVKGARNISVGDVSSTGISIANDFSLPKASSPVKLFCFRDHLIQLCPREVIVTQLSSGTVAASWHLNLECELEELSCVPLTGSQILIAAKNKAFVFNHKFGTSLAGTEFEGQVSLHCSTDKGKIVIASSNDSLLAISGEFGEHTLLESLGTGLVQEKKSDTNLCFSGVIATAYSDLDSYYDALNGLYSATKQRFDRCLTDLTSAARDGDGDLFDLIFLNFMKNNEADDIRKSPTIESYPVFDDADRLVDHNFVDTVSQMLLDFESNSMKLLAEKSLIYLLTHPLFPTTKIPAITAIFSPYARLLRQAVVTAPAIEPSTLLHVLFSTEDEEIFCDVATRLSEECGSAALQSMANEASVTREAAIQCIKRLIRLKIGWNLVSVLLDSSGPFVWQSDLLHHLSECVSLEVGSLESTSESLTLIDEALRKFGPSADAAAMSALSKRELKRLSKKQKRRTKEGPEVLTEEQISNKSMLALGTPLKFNATSGKTHNEQKKLAIKNAQSISRKVPLYSIEKLIL